MVMLRGADRPGVLAAIGGTFAERSINISDVSLGRRDGSDDALTVIRIDGDLPAETLAELSNIPMVQKVKVVRMP